MAHPGKGAMAARCSDAVDGYGYRKDFRTALPQFLAVSVKNLVLLGYGMTIGFPTILIPAVKDPKEGEVLHLEDSELSWLSSISYIVVPLGCMLSGVLTTPIGRRRAMQVVNVPFLVAWLIFHFAAATWHLYAALILTGLTGGLLEAPVLTYVAEVTQPHLRGALSATSSLCIILGVFMQFLFGIFMYWRTIALVNISIAVLSVVTLCFVPESPHWLVDKRRLGEARKSLQWLRGWEDSEAVDKELKDIQALFKQKATNNNEDEQSNLQSIKEVVSMYLDRSFMHPFLLITFSFFVGHFSGMTTLQTYAVSIFQMLEAPIDKYYATLVLGLVQLSGTIVCVLLVYRTGKRPLTLFSTAGAGVCCVLVACYQAYIKSHDVLVSSNNTTTNGATENTPLVNPYSWIPTTLLLLLALISHTGIRLLPWILIGEVFSAKTRATGSGIAGGTGYVLGFLTNKLYITMVHELSIIGTYGLYGIVCFIGCIVFYYYLPETEGKKLNDIENHFAGIRNMGNKVYRSKRINKPTEMEKRKEMQGNVNHSFEGDAAVSSKL